MLANHFGISNDTGAVGKLDRIVRWLKPILPYVKVNTDGSVGVNSAGMGGIIHNHIGNPIAAFSGPLNSCSILTAELLGLSHGLDICLRLGLHHVNIEIDSKLVIHVIYDNNASCPQDFYTIKKVKMALYMLNFDISHIYYEGNVCAVWLANYGSQSDIVQELLVNNLPPPLRGMINLDKKGIPYIRHA
ncbi:Putative ribonuclease H protein [Dendrobium catenatum]|uniref:Ribonuclease H protein n=1 Tax=Dendrobium catenatum TaxID=906689 RepID=A0A2I0VYB7_9ASPA|nr:Putative ribonuclease H protein [Dendrobium catenatum]